MKQLATRAASHSGPASGVAPPATPLRCGPGCAGVPAASAGHDLARLTISPPSSAAPIQRNGGDEDPWEEFKAAHLSGTDLPDLTRRQDSDYRPQREPEPTSAEEAELDEAGSKIDMGPTLSLLTSNVEKIGRSTSRAVRAEKVDELSQVVAQSQPTVASFQEVTDPELFARGEPGTSRRPATTGMMNQPLPDQSTLADQYAYLPGPAYQSGTYHESYPMMADTGTVHNPPKLSVFAGNEKTPQPYTGETLPFGKAVDPTKRDPKAARPTTAWAVELPAGRHNLRPPTKGWGSAEAQAEYARSHANLAHRRISYTPVNVLNVHTSPSISTIPRQVDQILGQQEVLAEANPATVGAGDWYMQKSAPTAWAGLQQSDVWSVDQPGVKTNFPGKGEGQTADHFVSSRAGLTPRMVRALPRPSRGSSSAVEEVLAEQADESELEQWTGVGIDHAPVYGQFDLAAPVRRDRSVGRRERSYKPY